MVCVGSLASMILHQKLSKNIFAKTDEKKSLIDEERIKFSLQDSFSEVMKSKHLRYLAIIVISYFFVINTVEVIWKEQLRLVYPLPSDFNYYMNTLTTWIGIVSTISGLFVALLIERFGWTRAALLTPAVMLVTSLLFFVFAVFKDYMGFMTLIFGTTPLAVAVFLGGLQNCLSKGAKYSLFDSTKEMAFIPLSREAQVKGKAAVDGVFSRLGKSGASLTLQVMILVFGSLISCTPYIMAIMLLVIMFWMESTRLLGVIIDKALHKSRADQNTKAEDAIK